MTDQSLATIPEQPRHSLGIIQVNTPHDVIVQATVIARELAKVIKDNHLTVTLQGRDYVKVEGWSTMGAMLGVLPREVSAIRQDDGGYEAVVELVRVNDGAVIGRASSIVGIDEKDRQGRMTWGARPEYARRSMAVTRATGKAYRLGFSWIIGLAGFEPTPAEEMSDVTDGEYTATGNATPPPPAPRQPVKASNPIAALVEAGISENANAASSLLNKYCPNATKAAGVDAILEWAGLYHQWRVAGTEPDKAAQNATEKIPFPA